MKVLIIISIVVGVAFNCSACQFNGQPNPTLPDAEIFEGVDPGYPIRAYSWSNEIEEVSIASPYLTVVNDTEFGRYLFETTQLFPEFADKTRRKTMSTYVTIKCTDGSFKFYYWTIRILPEITKAPEFRESSYNYQIKLPWSLDKPVNFDNPIIVSDKDYYQNIDITTSIEPAGFLSIVKTNLFVASGYYVEADEALFKLDLNLASGLAPGQYTFNLTVNDGILSARTQVTLGVTY